MKNLTVFFDIDGVIVDSEQLHFDMLQMLVPEQSKNFSSHELIGLSLEETLEHIKVPAALQAAVAASIIEGYKSKLTKQYLRQGVRTLISTLLAKNIPFGFVSTAPRDICLCNLALLELPTHIRLVSGDDVTKTKPHPDPYIAMMRTMQVHADDVIVIEDTDLGICAAFEAGISRIYAWPHALSHKQNYHQATAVISHLPEIAEFASLL